MVGNKYMEIMKTKNVTSLALVLCLSLAGAATVFTGCKGDRYNRSTGEYIDDKALSHRVSGTLHDNAEYKFDGVDVKAFRGVVQLSGFVNTQDQKSKAGEIAKTVEGVSKVENNITVKDNVSSK